MTDRQFQALISGIYWSVLCIGLLIVVLLPSTPPIADVLAGVGFTLSLTAGMWFISTRIKARHIKGK